MKLKLLIAFLLWLASQLPVGAEPPACILTPEEEVLAAKMVEARPWLRCHPSLVWLSRVKAADMRDRGYHGHTDLSGRSANWYARQVWSLPHWYPVHGNSVEIYAAGHGSPEAAWQAWLDSPAHRVSVLGETPHARSKAWFGVGYVRGGAFGDYAVSYSVPEFVP